MYHLSSNIVSLLKQKYFSLEDIVNLLSIESESDRNLILAKANLFENEYLHNYVNLFGLIEISTHCSENCNYCRLRRDNTEISRERMNRERIIKIAKEINKSGIKSIVIRSGYDDFYDMDRVSYIIYSIKKHADVSIMLSLGERSFEEYKEWKIAGASGYRLRFKSSNKEIYTSLNAFGSFEDRLKHTEQLRSLGYQICSGSIIGLPNQTRKDVAADLFLCSKLNLDVAEFLPFIRYNNTPFQSNKDIEKCKTDLIIAVAKIVLKGKVRCTKPKYCYNLEKDLINNFGML